MSNALSVKEVFKRVAPHYDLMNDLMSGGVHRLWKKQLVDMIPKNATKLSDIAAGTGDISFAALKQNKNLVAFCCEPSSEMIAAGKKNLQQKTFDIKNRAFFIQLNGEVLPFADNSIDCCTISFGIRNINNRPEALNEMFRILKPRGRFLCLEFSSEIMSAMQPIYNLYSKTIIPFLAKNFSGEVATYDYLVQSIKTFPPPAEFSKMIAAAGFAKTRFINLTFGIATIYSAYKI